MNAGIQYLAHLVQTKNDLNRRRRRFYSIFHVKRKYLGRDAKGQFMFAEYAVHRAYTPEEAHFGYLKAQVDMKAMTPEMRRTRKEIGARFVWSDHGAISAIEHDGKRYAPTEILALANSWRADSILLKDA